MIKKLVEYINENGLHVKAIEKFWETLNVWKNDAPEYYAEIFPISSQDDLDIVVSEVGLKSVEWPECENSNVTIKVLIYHAGRALGEYNMLFSISGSIEDDDFIWRIKPLTFFRKSNAPMNDKMVEQLVRHVKGNDLHKKAIKRFWILFDNWKNANPEKYSKIPIGELNVFVHSIGLRSYQWPKCDFNHVTITILIHYGECQLGNYVAWFSLSDNVDDDDFLEIY